MKKLSVWPEGNGTPGLAPEFGGAPGAVAFPAERTGRPGSEGLAVREEPGVWDPPGLETEAQVLTALTNGAGEVPEWVRLLPLGEVPLGDGREPLWVDDAALSAILAHFEARGLDLVVDYEHQSLTGLKAPAAGWIKELAARKDGLWARVQWTDTAREHIAAREYRYFSPVLRLEEKSRRPLALLQVALTNTPAINGLTPLVAKQGCPEAAVTGEQGALGHDPSLGDIQGGVASPLRVGSGGREPALATPGSEGQEILTELAALLDLPPHAGRSHLKGALLALKGNLEQLRGVQAELAQLKARMREKEIQDEVEAAMKVGKITPCQKESALSFARQDLEAFRSFVAKAMPQVPLGVRLNLADDLRAGSRQESRLSPRQSLICQALGIAPEAFKAQEARLREEKLL